jgi:leader peptidase (prepilin peptidase)/N-methyltransferase
VSWLFAAAGLVLGPWLAAVTVRLATHDPAARPGAVRVALTSVSAAAAVGAAPLLAGDRPAVGALAWFCTAALTVDAAVTGPWSALLRAVAAGCVAYLLGTAARLVQPRGFGGGDVKLLGLIGVVLGWSGWDVLVTGVFTGLLLGAAGSLVLVAVGRAGWRTAVPFGPPLLAGAYVALVLSAG